MSPYKDILIITSSSCWRVARYPCLVVLCVCCLFMFGTLIWLGKAKVPTCSGKCSQCSFMNYWHGRGFQRETWLETLKTLWTCHPCWVFLSSAYPREKITRSPVLHGDTANMLQLAWIKMNTLWQFSSVLTCSDAPMVGQEEDTDLSTVSYATPILWQLYNSWTLICTWSSPGSLAVCGFFETFILICPAKACLTAS